MKDNLWNDGWLFWEDKDAFALVWAVPEGAKMVDLPHDSMISGLADPKSLSGADGAYRNGGSYVYCKTLFAPSDWKKKTVSLRFEGISRSAMVYVNGARAASQPYEYSTFDVCLDNFLNYGEENIIRVVARTGDSPNSRWYVGGGIYRDVYLLVRELVCVEDIRISTKYLGDGFAQIGVAADLRNLVYNTQPLRLKTEVVAPDGVAAAESEIPLSLLGGSFETIEQTFTIEDPLLWSDEVPVLYTCKTTVFWNETHACETRTFGIRTITANTRRGLLINGRHVRLRGACIHHDSGLLGAATFADAEFRRIEKLKAAGFNAIRSAHNPLAQVTLEACDVLGVYVMDEAFDMWTRGKKDYDYAQFFEKWWKTDVKALVRKDFNHPCVIIYSLGNEIPEISTINGAALGRVMYSYVRDLDGSRLVTSCVNAFFASGNNLAQIVDEVAGEGGDECQSGNVNNFLTATVDYCDEIVNHPFISDILESAVVGMDVIGYNYSTARYESDGENYPNRIIVGSETYPPEIARNWEIMLRCNHVIGDFTWTGWDYIGEAGVGVPAYSPGEGSFGAQYPCQLAYVGDIDITGFRRPTSFYREIVFGLRKNPYITVQNPAHYGESALMTPWIISDNSASWTYPGFEGKTVIVEVYSPGDEVELILNGSSLGRKPSGASVGFRTLFELIYAPGVLEAISFKNGEELGRHMLMSALGEIRLCLEEEIIQNRIETELQYVNISLKNDKGVVFSARDTDITAKVSGSAVLVGFGSADPKPLTGYTDGISRTYEGRALAILRTRETHGETLLTVDSSDYPSAEIIIRW